MNSKKISFLRSLAHQLHPVVMIGSNGLTQSVLKEIDSSLNAHELIKIKVAGDDRAYRVKLLEEICTISGAEAIHHIGKQLVIYRPSEKAKIVFPR